MYVLLACTALVVGTLIGTVGVGGILLIPALQVFAGLIPILNKICYNFLIKEDNYGTSSRRTRGFREGSGIAGESH
jgi:hypothetical protein